MNWYFKVSISFGSDHKGIEVLKILKMWIKASPYSIWIVKIIGNWCWGGFKYKWCRFLFLFIFYSERKVCDKEKNLYCEYNFGHLELCLVCLIFVDIVISYWHLSWCFVFVLFTDLTQSLPRLTLHPSTFVSWLDMAHANFYSYMAGDIILWSRERYMRI